MMNDNYNPMTKKEREDWWQSVLSEIEESGKQREWWQTGYFRCTSEQEALKAINAIIEKYQDVIDDETWERFGGDA